MKIRLWYVKDSPSGKAQLYSKTPKARGLTELWVPVSIIEHRSVQPRKESEWIECTLTLPDWFAEKNGL